ncbi:MAG: malonyl-ACP O-methyltransferase BioC [Betaproteobacteria bacterium]|nr:malonyl-ACP O-methyltransferase BioC [Betaproteobacteria bacterium]
MSDESLIVKRLARRSFERAAATYDAAAVLQNEVCERMLARLEYVKLSPVMVLDAGAGTGNALPGLMRRFPRTRVIALDVARAMLQRAGKRIAPWERLVLRRAAPVRLCADIERLPLAEACVDLAWSNLALQWVNDPARAFAELRRVLAPGGLLMFSTFGPDTLGELRAAYRGTDNRTHVNRFIDMHDIGDMLVHSGFADPVMDMERVTLTYADVRELMRDLKAIGAHNVTQGRPPGLSGKSRIATVARNYEALRREGRLPATFEVVYGHAWKPLPRVSTTGRPVIDIKPTGQR